ncbi:MAG TPA: HAD family hydrolase [Acidimicrobiales bacterium]|nr:HAD family hydrolase [Acidimicrobiales bacterium]
MQPIDLVVTDLDGTLWHTDDHVPAAVLAAWAELDRRGVPVLVATGRRLASTRDPLARVGLSPPAVVLNGALGLDLATGERFHRAPFPVAEALAAYDAFVSVGLSPVVYVDHPRVDVFLGPAPDTNPGHVDQLGGTAGRVASLRDVVASEAVLGFSLIGVPFGPAEAAFERLQPLVEPHLDRSIDWPGLASLTAAPRDQSKWDGVLAYCEAAGLDSSRVLALADGPNDVELLTGAAVRLVPAVAHQAALALATEVIPAAADGGWAAVLDHVA